jgi:hypothetical protein
MTRLASILAVLAAAATIAVACSGAGPAAPWLTMPDGGQHAQRYFPYGQGTPHQNATCDDCHGAFDTFSRYDCLHCHDAAHADEADLTARHAGVDGFEFRSEACYACHAGGVAVDHARLFPIVAGSAHAGVTCASCHVDWTDRARLGCAGCHPHTQSEMSSAHAGVGGYGFDSTLCVRCHAESQVTRLTAHLPFRITGGARHSGSETGSCLRCHPSARTDKPWAQDFEVVDCLGCHSRSDMDDKHRGRSGYAYATATCLNCHADGSGGD